jgi:hypothetical protein
MFDALKFLITFLVTFPVVLFLISGPDSPESSKVYMKACRDAGGIPVIVARGPNVCINPGAVIKDIGIEVY